MAVSVQVVLDLEAKAQLTALAKALERQVSGHAERLALGGLLQALSRTDSFALRDLSMAVGLAAAQGLCVEEAREFGRRINPALKEWAAAVNGLRS